MADVISTLPPPPPPATKKSHGLRNAGIGVATVLVAMTLVGAIAGSDEKTEAQVATTVPADTRAPVATSAPTDASEWLDTLPGATTSVADDFALNYAWWTTTGEPALTDIEAKFDVMSNLGEADFAGMTDACIDLSVASYPLQTAPDTEFGRHINAAGALYQQAGEACAEMDYEGSMPLMTQANAELEKALAALGG